MKSPGAEAPGQQIPYFLLCNCNCPFFQPDPDNGQRADCHCRQITKDRPNRQWTVLFRRRRCRRKHHDHDKQTDEKNKGDDSFHGIGHPFYSFPAHNIPFSLISMQQHFVLNLIYFSIYCGFKPLQKSRLSAEEPQDFKPFLMQMH